MRGSSLLASAILALAWGGCAQKTIVVVDPYPCPDGSATGCTPGLLNDLVGYWHLTDPAGSTVARDSSGWGNDATLVGIDASTSWVAGGPAGRALSVQGQGYVNVPASASIDSITTQVSVAAWIFVQGTLTDYATAIARQIGTGFEQQYHLSINDGGQAILFLTTATSGQVVFGSPTTVPQQAWVHLAGTYDGTTARLYVNGVEVNSQPCSGRFAAETNPVTLSGNGNGTDHAVSEFVPGLLDEIMLYRRALSADEVTRIQAGALLP